MLVQDVLMKNFAASHLIQSIKIKVISTTMYIFFFPFSFRHVFWSNHSQDLSLGHGDSESCGTVYVSYLHLVQQIVRHQINDNFHNLTTFTVFGWSLFLFILFGAIAYKTTRHCSTDGVQPNRSQFSWWSWQCFLLLLTYKFNFEMVFWLYTYMYMKRRTEEYISNLKFNVTNDFCCCKQMFVGYE